VAIHEHEVAAVAAWARGDREAALDRAKAAADLELTLAPPSGPPDPIKPALELYGELLADAGRPADAVGAFEQALARTPKRTPSLAGLGAAAAAAGNAPLARRAYSELAATPGAAADSPAFAAARAWLSAR
jgi:tetratricopeptide (TPR) repeat protein